ncbi:MAG: DUF294 nucleotidyltransferase-like domain-containing protein [Archaeoglobaceae archaeon]|nr:DUF294 nucleotidyltransferase-like domain-containing protein [Archaeoglobaceae archaeon]MDW7989849.1 DUF294 nucleotidyltransferase-like domain-containing protein [Archaeoglobaceae archaeon]
MLPPREFIRRIKPFDLLTEEELNTIATKIDVEAFEEGELIFSNSPKKLYIVFSGNVCLYRDEELLEEFERGDIFGLGIYGKSKAIANSDVICFTIKRDVIDKISSENKNFREFFEKIASKDFRGLISLLEGQEFSDALLRKVADCITKNPVFCDIYTTIRDAAVKMELNGVGSIVVVKNDMTPIGIFTNRDLRKFVIHGTSKEEKVSAYMSSPVLYIEFDRPLFEAYQLLTSKRINHIVVTKYGKLHGVISAKDIMSQFEPFTSVSILHRKLGRATNLEEVKSINKRIIETIRALAKRGMSFYELSFLISSFYDLLTEKVITIVERENQSELGKIVDYVWVNMGSSARKEQILATDQDNMIIHSGEGDKLREFAKIVNNTLEFVGIPKCSGGYMAMNWCMSIEEWKKKFEEWMNKFTPENIRYLTVFLDLRAIHGKKDLLDELLNFISNKINAQVLRYLANDAVMLEPPKVGGIRGVSEVDIKKFGIYPIVNCTRVLALENSIQEIMNTRERILKLTELGVLSENYSKSILESYEFLQNLRLRNQVEGKGNLVKLKEIGRINHFILKDAFRIVQDYEKFLKGRFFVESGV